MKSIRAIAAPPLFLVAGAIAAFAIAGVILSGNQASAHPGGGTSGIDVASGAGTVGGAPVSVTITLHDIPAPGFVSFGFDIPIPAGLLFNAGSSSACHTGMGAGSLALFGTTYNGTCSNLPLPGTSHAEANAPGGSLLLGTLMVDCVTVGVHTLDNDATTAFYSTAAAPLSQVIVGNAGDGTITCTAIPGAPTATFTPLPTSTFTPTLTPTPCPGVCPTATLGVATPRAFTQTPTRTATAGATATKPPTTPGAPVPTQPGGGPGGVIQPPGTGSGGGESSSMTWIFAALGAGIAATLGLGIYGRRRMARR
jgi:hypothetical protein